jgi:uncharacterized membrane protein YesL
LAALRVWWRTLRHIYQRGYLYVWGTLCWALLTLPIVTAPAAWGGLVRMSHTALTSPTASLRDFWDGFKENLRRGLVVALVNVVIIVINVVNLLSYQGLVGLQYDLLRTVWIGSLAAWFSVQLYAFPLLYEMEKPSLVGAFRNAALMLLLNPLFTLLLWVGIVPIAILSSVFPALWLLLTGGIFAALGTIAVLDRLAAAGVRAPLVLPQVEPETHDIEP